MVVGGGAVAVGALGELAECQMSPGSPALDLLNPASAIEAAALSFIPGMRIRMSRTPSPSGATSTPARKPRPSHAHPVGAANRSSTASAGRAAQAAPTAARGMAAFSVVDGGPSRLLRIGSGQEPGDPPKEPVGLF
jgi:hypothetical protein